MQEKNRDTLRNLLNQGQYIRLILIMLLEDATRVARVNFNVKVVGGTATPPH